MTERRVVIGVVRQGRRLGRTLGFPTANVHPPASLGVGDGIYAVRARLDDGRRFDGVASLGRNPTVGGAERILEVWLFDFDEEIYGRALATELVAFLRPEQCFQSLDDLARQVRRDAEAARAALARLAPAA